MIDYQATAALVGGVGLLERAINYALGALHTVGPEALSRPTPCLGWNVETLLGHLDDSLTALGEAIDAGHVGLAPAASLNGTVNGAGADPVAGLRRRATHLLGAWTGVDGRRRVISIGGSPLTGGIVTGTGAIEVAVHGWDVARACGRDLPIPPLLAEELLELATLLVSDADRPVRFAARIEVPASSGPSDRLIAFLGRRPRETKNG